MRYPRFKTEEELLRAILQLFSYNTYPKVSAIGGRKINPDIDMLLIERTSQYQRTIGYEIKLIKFNKRSDGLTLKDLPELKIEDGKVIFEKKKYLQ